MSKKKEGSGSSGISEQIPYVDFLGVLDIEMENIRDEYSLGQRAKMDRVFNYLIASRVCGLCDDLKGFFDTDGPKDMGIDFGIEDEEGGRFIVCQCKSFEYWKGDSEKPKTFQGNAVTELDEGLKYLLGGDGDANDTVKRFRAKYQFAKSNADDEVPVVLDAYLAVLGNLSKDGMTKFNTLKSEMSEFDIELHLINWEKLNGFIRADSMKDVDVSSIELSLEVENVEKDVLEQDDGWLSALVSLGGFVEGYETYSTDLFDMNVRAQNDKSHINSKIAAGLKKAEGRELFKHLNNGILLLADDYEVNKEKKTIFIRGAQVINGCQTVTSVYKAYFSEELPEEQEAIKQTKALVKVLKKTEVIDGENLNRIIVATNTQNAMKARNLKSNNSEQRALQKEFAKKYLKKMRFFYIRKDDELAGAQKNTKRFKERIFLVEGTSPRKKPAYRSIDNLYLAKAWLAWLGDTETANERSTKWLFEDEYKIRYDLIYNKRPTISYWEYYKGTGVYFSLDQCGEDHFENITPSVFQYLTAMAFWNYAVATIKQNKETREQALERIGCSSTDEEEQEKQLLEDRTFFVGDWRVSMTATYAALMSFVLCNAFKDLSEATCKKICQIKDVRIWIEHGMSIDNVEDDFLEADGLLRRVFYFVDKGVRQVLTEDFISFNKEAKVKPRLGKKETFVKMKKAIHDLNRACKENPYIKFKPEPDKEVYESLRDYLSKMD